MAELMDHHRHNQADKDGYCEGNEIIDAGNCEHVAQFVDRGRFRLLHNGCLER